MKKRFLIALFFLLLLSTYNIQNTFNIKPKLSIKTIEIENNMIIDERIIKQKLAFIYKKNLFLLQKDDLKSKFNELDFVESFKVKKIYPNKIKIKIFEKIPIAILQDKKERKYFTENGSVISFVALKKFNNLPIVFGDKKNFEVFYKSLKKINFPFKEIKIFYLFETGRWDLLTIKDITIKLPINNYEKSLENYLDIKDQVNFQKYKIFDYRIKDQLILK